MFAAPLLLGVCQPSVADVASVQKQVMQLVDQTKDQKQADTALHQLAKLGKAARPASPHLVSMLTDRSQLWRRSLILDTLEKIGVEAAAAPTLIAVLHEEGKFTQSRLAAIRLLGETDPPAQDALDELHEIAQDKTDPAGRQAALQAIGSIMDRSNGNADAALELRTEIKQLRGSIAAGQPTRARLDALEQIAKLGPEAAPLCADLLPLLDDQELQVREAAVNAFCSIGPKAAPSAKVMLNKLLASTDELQRDQLSRALLAIDPSGHLIITALTPALDDPFKARAALAVLDQIGTHESQDLADRTRKRWCLK